MRAYFSLLMLTGQGLLCLVLGLVRQGTNVVAVFGPIAIEGLRSYFLIVDPSLSLLLFCGLVQVSFAACRSNSQSCVGSSLCSGERALPLPV